jgi:oligogalacturonide lyase
MTVGQAYPPECKTYTDSQTGRRVTRLTDSPAEDYHLYFYNPSVTRDGKYLIFISERTGISNLFRLNLDTGEIAQLTDSAPARADYYPFTYQPICGVGSCLPAQGAGQVFYFAGNDLFAVDVETPESRRLLHVPDARRPSILNANAQGTTLVFATWDEKLFAERSALAYAGAGFAYAPFFQETASTIVRLNTESRQCEEILRRERFWINHVLIHPTNPDLILYCHEYTDLPDRMWLLNAATGENAPIAGQAADEWYEHEFWSWDGTRVYFHGGAVNDDQVGFCGWYDLATGKQQKFFHHTQGRSYGHYNLHPDGRSMVTDGEGQPGCISKVHLGDGAQIFEPLCRHDTYKYGDDQRCHPHPSFTPDESRVIFTSNRTGTSNVYLTDWN